MAQRIVDAGNRVARARRASSPPSVPTCRRSSSISTAPRPRRSACAVDRRLRDAPDLHGRPLRQRLRPLRPALPRLRPGGGRSAHAARGREATVGALGARRDGAALDPRLARRGRPARATSRTTTSIARRKIQGEAAPGYSSGQALDRMEAIAREVLPATMSFEWTGTAYQERQAGSRGAAHPGALAAGGVPVPRRAVRELEPAARHHAGRAARLPRAHSAPRRCADSTTTSTARSDSSR